MVEKPFLRSYNKLSDKHRRDLGLTFFMRSLDSFCSAIDLFICNFGYNTRNNTIDCLILYNTLALAYVAVFIIRVFILQ